MSKIPYSKLAAAKRAARDAGVMPEKQSTGLTAEDRRRLREERKDKGLSRSQRRELRNQVRQNAPGRKITFAYQVGDLVRVQRERHGIPKGSMGMVMDERSNTGFLISACGVLDWFHGSLLRPVNAYDEDDDE